MSENSYRTILRASSIIGGASVINILAGLAKMKAAAVLLGPAGVGLVGLYQSLMQTAGQVAGLGIANSGTRQVAAAGADAGAEGIAVVRRALFWGTLIQGVVGALLFWLASEWIAARFIDQPERAIEVAWLALGVGLTVAAGAQMALLRGLRRIGDIARIQVANGIIGAALGVAALMIWGEQGLLGMVLIAPVVTFLLGHYYVRRLEPAAGEVAAPRALAKEWSAMARLGFAFMISGLITVAGQLAVRVLVQRELGTEALGQFQAAWTIGMTYLTFVLGAMGTDFYPRLAAAITEREAAVRLVNEQTEVAVLLCGPVLIAMLALAPWVIRLLYTAEFAPAVEILRWQLLGDILKVMAWPLGFVLLAGAAGKTFVITESVAIVVLVSGVAVAMPFMGIAATGVAFLGMYLIYLPLVRWLGGVQIGFRWSRAVKAQAMLVILAAIAVELAARVSDIIGATLGISIACALAAWSLMRLSSTSAATGRLAQVAKFGERLRIWILALR
ncbi:O-antigen translocase [Wenzhouxiangella marina]|uniref:Polysaccharide biosynthesis protein n=1 Tax=Wenzhouxiangella marina TaxID=1579979 RepID=A0A0K0XYJ1_9GAMM|nr:O-antigen translocase [Wenzhouxiangella marina]AKS42758.1 Polysaccharide biosynthesis protein [Wenzhouxiangella marina]MBB6087565.1 PST family polysaccharide transporter [Wenzhouxiangella marina]